MNKLTFGLLAMLCATPTLAQNKPLTGDRVAPQQVTTLNGQQLEVGNAGSQRTSLVFIDSLCPMPQFPDCEAKIQRLNALYANKGQEQWIGVVKGFYIDQNHVDSFAKRMELKLPLVFDQDNSLFQSYQVYATPYQVWIGNKGEILYRGNRLYSSDAIDSAAATALPDDASMSMGR